MSSLRVGYSDTSRHTVLANNAPCGENGTELEKPSLEVAANTTATFSYSELET